MSTDLSEMAASEHRDESELVESHVMGGGDGGGRAVQTAHTVLRLKFVRVRTRLPPCGVHQ